MLKEMVRPKIGRGYKKWAHFNNPEDNNNDTNNNNDQDDLNPFNIRDILNSKTEDTFIINYSPLTT